MLARNLPNLTIGSTLFRAGMPTIAVLIVTIVDVEVGFHPASIEPRRGPRGRVTHLRFGGWGADVPIISLALKALCRQHVVG